MCVKGDTGRSVTPNSSQGWWRGEWVEITYIRGGANAEEK